MYSIPNRYHWHIPEEKKKISFQQSEINVDYGLELESENGNSSSEYVIILLRFRNTKIVPSFFFLKRERNKTSLRTNEINYHTSDRQSKSVRTVF
jgi:hypothetical protein